MTERQDDDEVTLNCFVSTIEHLKQTVKWLFEDKNSQKVNASVKMAQSESSAFVIFPTSYLNRDPKYRELFKCEVTDDNSKKVQLFPFSSLSSGENLNINKLYNFCILTILNFRMTFS